VRVVVKPAVYEAAHRFYVFAMVAHPTLDERVVLKKEQRMFEALQSLGSTYFIYPLARYIPEWKEAGYHDFICEDFHFAFRIAISKQTGEQIVSIEDARHSLLFHD